MDDNQKHLTFFIERELYGIPLDSVEKVIRAVKVVHYGEKDSGLQGFINMAGQIIPVVDLRKRLGLARKKIDINDRMIIAKTSSRQIAIVVDKTGEIIDPCPGQKALNRNLLLEKGCIKRIATIGTTTIKLCDPDRFLLPGKIKSPGIQNMINT
ncbi:MAG: chemotaxis protein CheW [Deltaproteobacteria bacterium]|nr:chemotaxis protein CheW [Deltaproteobacteria bacterium]